MNISVDRAITPEICRVR